jgi:predicted MPP superfamily phosphohydrolase
LKTVNQVDYEALSKRLGEEKLRQRLLKQAYHWAQLTHQGEGIFRIERYISIDKLAEWALRLSLLWTRAHRNIFNIREIEVHWKLEGLPRAFEGFRLLQLSDLHVDIDPELAPVIATAVRNCAHDALVITGDYRNTTNQNQNPSMEMMPQILMASDRPRFGIMGNHDFIEKVPDLEKHGLRILLNESACIERGGAKLWLVGVDDPHFYQTHDFAAARAQVPDGACSILLCHSPEVHREAAKHPFQLMLSGHTHGGQICLPGGRHLICPTKGLPRRFIRGRWHSGSLQGYTSPGTGSCGVAARLNCPPEMTVHILHRA